MPLRSQTGYFLFELRATEADEYPSLADVHYFLHDLNLLYELVRVVADPKYRHYEFSRFFAYRNRQRIDPDDQLRIERLRQESPLDVVVVVAALPAAATTIWIVIQILEKLWNMTLNREILKLNREKLRRELEQPRAEAPAKPGLMQEAAFREEVTIREAEYTLDRIEAHLSENPIRIREIEVTYVRELPPKADEDK